MYGIFYAEQQIKPLTNSVKKYIYSYTILKALEALCEKEKMMVTNVFFSHNVSVQ